MTRISKLTPGMLVVACLVCAAALPARADEAVAAPAMAAPVVTGPQLLAAAQLPVPVRATSDRLTAGGKVLRYEKEAIDGKTVFMVTVNLAGAVREFTIREDGLLVSEEEDVSWSDVPDPVRTAAEKFFGRKRGLEAAKVTAGGATTWEVSGQKDGAAHAGTFTAEGDLLSEAAEPS